ncbi:MAG: gliding motility-associated C-terminal domain-containing protein [Bacteroidia bacterium]|nr:gliding motility-associated C-terminal domain-containing protein [Bacteroidia bacterium]
MKLKLNTLIAVFVLMGALITKNYAQEGRIFNPSHIFDTDSLRGFDEEAARRSAISEQFLGSEFKVRMYQLKRKYISDKYNLLPKQVSNNAQAFRPAAVPGCVNEDFEASTSSATLTASNQITGWSVGRGTHYPGPSGANSCNLLGYTNAPPVESAIFVVPSGYVDPNIGTVYPLFSVFGTSAGDPAAETANPQITQGMFGDNFIRINSDQLGTNAYSIEKLSKTFLVTANNALFQFAFISVFYAGHGCCDAGAFQLRLFNATTNSAIACPSFSASALSSACTNTSTGITYLNAQTGTPATPNNANVIFNKWQVSSMDLSSYIGQNITIEVTASDCTGGGHYGYVYFDAQCGPMVVYGNGTAYPAGSTNVTVPTCGAAGATLCAAACLGPYYWNGPNIPPNSPLATASFTNACIITTLSATYTLFMNPPGGCAPIQRTINSTVTPAPGLFASAIQAVCGSTLATINVTPTSSASNPASVTWAPAPLTLNSTTTTGTYTIPLGPAPNIVTITATDPIGCKVSATAAVLPAPPIPTFSITNSSTSWSVTCDNPSVNLNAVTNYTYGTPNYFWSSASATFSSSNVSIGSAGNYTVIMTDPVTNCSSSKTLAVSVFTTAPLTSMSPTFQNITCNTTNTQNIVITSLNPTVNVSHLVLSPLGGSLLIPGTTASYVPTGVGIFTVVTVNSANGCFTNKTFSVSSNQGFPTFTVINSPAPGGYTLGCNTKSVTTINIANASATGTDQVPTGGPVSYTLLSPSASTVVPSGPLSTGSSYTVNAPGTWTVVVKDNVSFCETRVPISVLSNTFGPSIDSLLIPQNVLDCNTPSITLKAVSIVPNVDYVWAFPGTPGQVPTNTLVVSTSTNIAATNTLVNNFTVTIKDNNNTCITTTVVPIYRNFYAPAPLISAAAPALSCKVTTIELTNSSSPTTPTNNAVFPGGSIPLGILWSGPSPQLDKENSSTYIGSTPGAYTLVVKDSKNGCTSVATYTLGDNKNYPIINSGSSSSYTIDCGESTNIAAISNPATGVTYKWTAPDGKAMSCFTCAVSKVSDEGNFVVLVTNTVNGCATFSNVIVYTNNVVTTNFNPILSSNFAPVTATFVNLSSSTGTNGTSGIASTWGFGNGTSSLTPSASISPVTTFNLPGSYTVTLYTNKGNCAGVVSKVINVEIPSSMVIPNIFTPNGDGINDIFFLKISNLASIKASIYDRWGHKVYEIDTQNEKNNAGGKENVNLSWDGKNQLGKELPEGTYFYVIKATGKDDKDYDQKGTITLVR